jgi:hypothetical protein
MVITIIKAKITLKSSEVSEIVLQQALFNYSRLLKRRSIIITGRSRIHRANQPFCAMRYAEK